MIKIFIFFKNSLSCKTYVIECSFVLLVLAITAMFFGEDWKEWIAVFAVFLTFCHASVANRMEEQEAFKKASRGVVSVDCYKMNTFYFYAKETLWFSYFVLLGAYSALAGVVVFLMYPYWRKVWRSQNPLK